MSNSLCIAILSYRKPKILEATLETYKANGLLNIVQEKIVYFNSISKPDIEVANKYNLKIMGSDKNVGIGHAFKTIATNTQSKYILLLENDFTLIEPKASVVNQINVAKCLIRCGFKVIKLRHRKNPGDPLYSRNKIIQTHLLGMIHWANDKIIPPEVRKFLWKNTPVWYTEAKFANYTNNPCMYNRKWFCDNVAPYCNRGGIALEGDIQKWWEKQYFLVGQLEGLFKHGF